MFRPGRCRRLPKQTEFLSVPAHIFWLVSFVKNEQSVPSPHTVSFDEFPSSSPFKGPDEQDLFKVTGYTRLVTGEPILELLTLRCGDPSLPAASRT